MAYVITDTCLKDVLCADACPTDCIHPKKDEPQFETVTQMYVDPEGCIDCGACVAVCPSNSMFPADEVPEDKKDFIEKNAKYYAN
jgi:ferredoxin